MSIDIFIYHARFHIHHLFWVSNRICLHALVLKKQTVFSYCAVLQRCISLHLKLSVLASVSLRPLRPYTRSPLICQLTHVWASTANNNRATLLTEFQCAISYANYEMHEDVARCHKVTELMMGILTRRSVGTFSLGKRSFCHLHNFQDFLHAIWKSTMVLL